MAPHCRNTAIRSHVLQKNRVIKHLKNKENKIYQPQVKTLFSNEKGLLTIKKMGINEGFVFFGFCEKCDTKLFESIEINDPDLDSNITMSLFAYRALCFEYRKKEVEYEMIKYLFDFFKKHWPEKILYVDFKPLELSIQGASYYKAELEREIWDNEIRFNHYKLELTKQNLCFSTSLTIYDENNILTHEHDQFGYTRTEPLARSIVNYFPLENNSYFLASVHKEYPCYWILDQLEKLKQDQLKTVSDFITYRTENWIMSPDLYDSIKEEVLQVFIEESDAEAENFDYKIESDFNLFSHC